MSDGGKGDKQRPLSIKKESFDDNWDRIFDNKSELLSIEYQLVEPQPGDVTYSKKEALTYNNGKWNNVVNNKMNKQDE